MSPDLHIVPDVVDDLARLARAIADDLDRATADPGPAAELRAFASAATRAAHRVRVADRLVAERFR